ncbi:MAG: 16S rRNA (uracil(1498)-N(3))-methyltransferase [Nitrosomonas sp.]|uniref:16S rRNA (uracil(1498)-N(3))-methyltransferase n=1 Tax=Nitrosomonas sp. TaxID=42353 RepID=UPI0032EBD527
MHARFYHPEEITAGTIIELSAENKHHAARVLRLKEGDALTLFNGQGGEFSAHITSITKSSTTVRVDAYHAIDRESPLSIELAQAVCVNEKMDWIIQKAVELGVTRIQPVTTARSIVHLSGERADKRQQHWQKIVISACEQCGRNYVPQVLPLISLPEWLSRKKSGQSPRDVCFMLSTTATQSLKEIPKPPADANLALVIGPEGGFTPEEEVVVLHTGFVPVRLGKRILRTESAALTAIAALQTLWGDF